MNGKNLYFRKFGRKTIQGNSSFMQSIYVFNNDDLLE